MRRGNASTARNAPFGTDIQPNVKTKIVGGKTVEVKEEETPPSSSGSQTSSTLENGPNGTPPMRYQPPVESNSSSFNNTPNVTPGNNYRKIYSQTAQRDTSNSHIHSKAKLQEKRPGAPTVLPPINSNHNHGDDDDDTWSDSTSAENVTNIKDILQKPFPVHLSSSPVLDPIKSNGKTPTLTEQVSQHLVGYDPLHFKEMYTDLAEFDHALRGYVSQPQMNMIAHKHAVPIPLETLRLLFANFASGSNPDSVNYEKLIQFLARAQLGSSKAQTLLQHDIEKFVHPNSKSKNNNEKLERLDAQITHYEAKEEAERREQQRRRDESREKKRQKEQQKWKPSFEPKKPLRTFTELEDAMMIRMLEEQFTDGKKKQAIDVNGMRQMSIKRDKRQDGTFTRKDLDDLFLFYRVPIQGSLLNKVLQRMDTGNGQLSWVTFLEILERVESGDVSTPRGENGQSKSRQREARRASEGLAAPLKGAPPVKTNPFGGDPVNSGLGNSGSRDNNRTRSREGPKPSLAAEGLRPVVVPTRPSTWPKRPIKDPLPSPGDSEKDVSSPPWLKKPLARIEVSKNHQDPSGVTAVEMEITRNDTPPGEHVTPSPPTTPTPEREDYELDQLKKLAHEHKRHRHQHYVPANAANEQQAQQKREKKQREEWFKGFLHLAKGLYSTDTAGTGCLEKDEILRLVNNYNLIYQLHLAPLHIKRVIETCCHERDVVPIQPVLEILRQNKK